MKMNFSLHLQPSSDRSRSPHQIQLLLAVGTKLEHVITQLAHEIAEKHIAIEGELVVQPSDNHFWFHRPSIVLFLMHFILFQNAFEIAFFFWMWLQYGFDSCIMGHVHFIIPRLVIGPLNWSKRTAEIIWSARKEEIITDSDLREIDLYSFQGLLKHKGKAKFGAAFHQWQTDVANFNIDGHYPVRELWDRARSCWTKILTHESRSVLVVAHNAVNQALVATAIGLGRVFQDFTAEQLWCECAGFHPTTRGWVYIFVLIA